MNKLVKRTIMDSQPRIVQHELTEYAQTLKFIVANLARWGTEHRKEIIGR